MSESIETLFEIERTWQEIRIEWHQKYMPGEPIPKLEVAE